MCCKFIKLLVLTCMGLSCLELVIDNSFANTVVKDAQKIINAAESEEPLNKEANEIINIKGKLAVESFDSAKQLVNTILNLKNEQNLNLTIDSPSNENIDFKKFSTDFEKIKTSKKLQDQIPNLLIFASFSLPQKVLEQLAEQSRKTGGVMVFRGTYKGSLKKTISLIHQLNKKGTSAIIHPKLFSEFNVTRVPTFILNQKANTDSCLRNKCTPIIDKIIGNLPLQYVLETFAESGNYKALAKSYLKNLESRI